MGGLHETSRSSLSLDRLKALDSLPDLPSQLQEAKELCTHSARADMVAKWLLEKLKSSEDVRRDQEAWKCLQSTFRLLSPERMATLLASHDFIGTLKATLDGVMDAEALLVVITDVVSLILDVAQGTSGSNVKAFWSVPANVAAPLLESWLQNLHSFSESIESAHLRSALSIAVRIWGSRKHANNENELFAKHCLPPGVCLLVKVSQDGFEETTKRKRSSSNDDDDQSCAQMIETLLARHIILPARAAFFHARDSPRSMERKDNATQRSESLLYDLLEPLRGFSFQSPDEHQSYHAALPSLLDMSLRCVPMPNSKLRTREGPWIEALFESLQACNISQEGTVIDQASLTRMLKVVSNRASLPTEAVQKIVSSYPYLNDSGTVASWELIAQVIELDADVFTTELLAEKIFTAITEKSHELELLTMDESASDDSVLRSQEQSNYPKAWYRDRIIAPIIKTFAKSRKPFLFTEMWLTQLKKDPYNTAQSLWTEIDGPVRSLMEESLTDDQILELFRKSGGVISETSKLVDNDEDSISQPNVFSALVILNALLGGLRTESLLLKLQGSLESLFADLLYLCDELSDGSTLRLPAPTSKFVWPVLRKTFELWFPDWAVKQSHPAMISAKCVEIMSSRTAKTAFSVANAIHPHRSIAARTKRQTIEAESFLASLCCISYQCQVKVLGDGVSSPPIDTIDHFVKSTNSRDLETVVRYPELLKYMANLRFDFFSKCIDSASRSDMFSVEETRSMTNGILALAAAAVARDQTDVVDDLTRAAMDHIKPPEWEGRETTATGEAVAIEVLSALPAASISRSTRELALNELCDTAGTTHATSVQQRQRRLALLVNLMEIPNATSKLSTDPTIIWKLAFSASVEELVGSSIHTIPEYDDPETVALLMDLTRLNMRHLLATQDQERSRSMLISISADVKKIMAFIVDCTQESIHGVALALNLFMLASAILEEFERDAKGDLKQELPHRQTDVLFPFCQKVFELNAIILRSVDIHDHDSSTSFVLISLHSALATLRTIPETVMETSNSTLNSAVGSLLDALSSKISITEVRSEDIDGKKSRMKQLHGCFARCYEVGCKYATSTYDVRYFDLALELLDLQLFPVEQECVITAFGHTIDGLDSSSKTALIERLLSEDITSTASNLILFQECIDRLQKGGIEVVDDDLFRQLFSRLLAIMKHNESFVLRRRTAKCVSTMLRVKSSFTNQLNIEQTLETLLSLLLDRPGLSVLYLDVCRIVSILLLHHRSRLQGRFHFVLNVLQTLLAKLFRRVKAAPRHRTQSKGLNAKHAQAFTRLLTLFCEPPQLRRQIKATELVDESRKEQAHIGQYVQYLLHYYCTQILKGTLANGMREALAPALWSMIEAIEIHHTDGIKSLSASMNNSERAVLRGVYDEWKRFGKWRGG